VEVAIHEFAGTDQVVADYLIEQVLAGHGDRTRFLLFTSVVQRFTPELAASLTGEDDIDPVLDELRRDNLVTTEGGGWFRYHGLVSELLRSRLRAEFPEEVPRLHAVAARWFGERELLSESVRHAAQARDGALLARTVRDVSLVQVFGDQGSEIQPVLEQHRTGLALQQLGPRVTLAAARLSVKDADGALRLVTDISSNGGSVGHGAPRRASARATVVGLAAARQLADLPNALLWGDRADALDLGGFDDGEGEWLRATVLANRGWASLWAGPVNDAVETLQEAVATSTAIDDTLMQIDSRALLSVALAWKAHASEAQGTAESVVRFADERGLGSALELAPAFVALAWVHDQRGEPDAMADALDRSREIMRGEEPSDSPLTATQSALVARLRRWRGEPGIGANLLSALRRKLRHPGHRMLEQSMALDEAGMLAAVGREASALDILDEEDRQVRGTADQVVRARLEALAGHPADAVTRLQAHLRREMPDHLPDLIEAWVVLALCQASTGDEVSAWESFERALFLASDNRLLRAFLLDDGVAALTEAQVEAGTEHGDLCRELIDRLHALGPDDAAAPPAEELSRRERVVLRYLATLMSVQEIAGEMFVSTNTVKTHIKHIYRKLDVSRRRDAVESALARRLLRGGDGVVDRPVA
jgi:LuxR family maltose regulon positive regulatory protein